MWDLYNKCNGDDWVQMEQIKTEGKQTKFLGGKHRKKLRKWIVKCRELAWSRMPQSWAGISKRVCKQSTKTQATLLYGVRSTLALQRRR